MQCWHNKFQFQDIWTTIIVPKPQWVPTNTSAEFGMNCIHTADYYPVWTALAGDPILVAEVPGRICIRGYRHGGANLCWVFSVPAQRCTRSCGQCSAVCSQWGCNDIQTKTCFCCCWVLAQSTVCRITGIWSKLHSKYIQCICSRTLVCFMCTFVSMCSCIYSKKIWNNAFK